MYSYSWPIVDMGSPCLCLSFEARNQSLLRLVEAMTFGLVQLEILRKVNLRIA